MIDFAVLLDKYDTLEDILNDVDARKKLELALKPAVDKLFKHIYQDGTETQYPSLTLKKRMLLYSIYGRYEENVMNALREYLELKAKEKSSDGSFEHFRVITVEQLCALLGFDESITSKFIKASNFYLKAIDFDHPKHDVTMNKLRSFMEDRNNRRLHGR